MANTEVEADVDGFAVLARQRVEFHVSENVGGFVAANRPAGDDDSHRTVCVGVRYAQMDVIEIDADFISGNKLLGRTWGGKGNVVGIPDNRLEVNTDLVIFFEGVSSARSSLASRCCFGSSAR